MKNIHLILVNKAKASLYHCSNTRNFFTTRQTPDDLLYEMYITNDEEIKVGDWVLFENSNNIRKSVDSTFTSGVNNIRIYADKKVFKIILTTDPHLIKDGVQAIDDEFLEWFVKNPSCEEVEVFHHIRLWYNMMFKTYQLHKDEPLYKIIIPKDEPKQDPLEEAAERLAYDSTEENKGFPSMKRFIEGAKWMQERSYSEEEVYNLLCKMPNYFNMSIPQQTQARKEWFEQFKKK